MHHPDKDFIGHRPKGQAVATTNKSFPQLLVQKTPCGVFYLSKKWKLKRDLIKENRPVQGLSLLTHYLVCKMGTISQSHLQQNSF